jgi:site-specific DNA-methyltransferase (adenine-specific)
VITANQVLQGDCLELMKQLPDKSVDLVFASPPYEDARLYAELNYKIKGQDWVDWCVSRFLECLRVTKGLVAWVVEGKTRKFQWSATPALLMADLHRAGVKLRKPPAFHRCGIPGSGGPDWLRNDYEFVVCASRGKLPWSDNTAMGAPCKYKPGGDPSHRLQDGRRVNGGCREFHYKGSGRRDRNGNRQSAHYKPPEIANPGNVIYAPVGKGSMGHDLAHDNEAPYPEKLAEFFIRSFCPPNGVVLDPFCGSGTTPCVAKKFGRQYIAFDIRQSQVDLTLQRLADPVYEP